MNKEIPAISVIIPMYNAEKYISECLDSILAQTFTDYEVIVVDDCSTDNSCSIVESYMPKFTRGGGGQITADSYKSKFRRLCCSKKHCHRICAGRIFDVR